MKLGSTLQPCRFPGYPNSTSDLSKPMLLLCFQIIKGLRGWGEIKTKLLHNPQKPGRITDGQRGHTQGTLALGCHEPDDSFLHCAEIGIPRVWMEVGSLRTTLEGDEAAEQQGHWIMDCSLPDCEPK